MPGQTAIPGNLGRPKKNPGANEEAHSTQKGGQRNGGGAQTGGRRQRKEAGRKGRDERKRATVGGQGWREAKLGASPTGNPRFGYPFRC